MLFVRALTEIVNSLLYMLDETMLWLRFSEWGGVATLNKILQIWDCVSSITVPIILHSIIYLLHYKLLVLLWVILTLIMGIVILLLRIVIMLRRISEIHPNLMAMQYPLHFSYGEDGFSLGILKRLWGSTHESENSTLTMREYYAFFIQQRLNEGNTLISDGRLFQQYIVDAYCCIEGIRLRWIPKKKKKKDWLKKLLHMAIYCNVYSWSHAALWIKS